MTHYAETDSTTEQADRPQPMEPFAEEAERQLAERQYRLQQWLAQWGDEWYTSHGQGD